MADERPHCTKEKKIDITATVENVTTRTRDRLEQPGSTYGAAGRGDLACTD